MEKPQIHTDIPKILFTVLFISFFIIGSFWILNPFIVGFIWAGMIVVATWPLLIILEKRVKYRWLSTMIMMILILLIFVIPIILLISSVIDNSAPLIELAKSPSDIQPPQLLWLKEIPMVGNTLYETWHSILVSGGNALMAKIQPYIGQAANWFFAQALNIGRFALHLVVMLLFSGLLFLQGENVVAWLRHFAVRLAGQRGDAAILLASMSIRAVALGVVLTALIQAVIGGIGLGISGVPYATVLTVLMFICCLAQLGPLFVLVPSILWLFWTGDTTWGIVMIIWGGIVATMDGVLRPFLIKMGADLPMVLILTGVIGGILTLGMIGLFIGSVVLAVAHSLLNAWINEVPKPDPDLTETVEFMNKNFIEKE
ncbi:TPA: AI-2E family transporter YdiK [Proteus mirabilis]|nr:AI-2E family transporter YdiK [Proteus mirabilis]